MAKLDERLVLIEDLPFTLDDFDQMFGGRTDKHWAYRWYKIKGAPEYVYLVAYESIEELEEKERFR